MSIPYNAGENRVFNGSIAVLSLPNATAEPVESSKHGHIHQETGLDRFREDYAKIHGYLSLFVCVFGIISNIANIVVLTRRNMITSTNIILTWLAVADTLKMTDYLPFVIHFYIGRDPDIEHYFATRSESWMYYFLFHASFSIVCHTIAIWLTISLAIFRFLYIWYPTRGGVWCSPRRARIVICIVYVAVAVICAPNYAMNDFELLNTTSLTNKNETIMTYEYVKSKALGGTTFDNANTYIQSILVKIVPCIMLTLLTFLLIYAMHKAYLKRRALKSEGRTEDAIRHHEHNRTTGMLLAVVFLFLITELPQGILTMMMNFNPLIKEHVYNNIGDLLDIVALCNNAVNFILYCSMSKQFRDTFVRIFCGCCPKNDTAWSKLKLITSTRNGQRNYSTTENATHV